MNSHDDQDAILYAYSVEAVHDRDTLERYLTRHPHLAEELIDLHSELRLTEAVEPSPETPDPAAEAAWKEFLGCRPTPSATGTESPFARFRGPAFASLAAALNFPRSILLALRDRDAEPSSIPNWVVRHCAKKMGCTVGAFSEHLALPQDASAALAFKSDDKPSHQGQITFRELVLNTPMSDAQRAFLLREHDEDELA